MTLLITLIAAVIVTVLWYVNPTARLLKVGLLCYMFWGASMMWMVDAAAEYIELRSAYFTPAFEDMINDAFLGCSVITLALVIWAAYVLFKDPMHTIADRKKENR